MIRGDNWPIENNNMADYFGHKLLWCEFFMPYEADLCLYLAENGQNWHHNTCYGANLWGQLCGVHHAYRLNVAQQCRTIYIVRHSKRIWLLVSLGALVSWGTISGSKLRRTMFSPHVNRTLCKVFTTFRTVYHVSTMCLSQIRKIYHGSPGSHPHPHLGKFPK